MLCLTDGSVAQQQVLPHEDDFDSMLVKPKHHMLITSVCFLLLLVVKLNSNVG